MTSPLASTTVVEDGMLAGFGEAGPRLVASQTLASSMRKLSAELALVATTSLTEPAAGVAATVQVSGTEIQPAPVAVTLVVATEPPVASEPRLTLNVAPAAGLYMSTDAA
jgi:hypothetical protein